MKKNKNKIKMNTIKAVIFDCDGVLADSELVSCALSVLYLRERGYEICIEDFINKFSAVTFDDQMKIINDSRRKNELPLIPTSEEEKIKREKNKMEILSDSNKIKPIEGVIELILFLKEQNIPFAVGSGSGNGKLNTVLTASGLINYFDKNLIIGSSSEGLNEFKIDGELSKVAIFKLAHKKLREKYGNSIEFRDCLVIEDAKKGIEAAQFLNMQAWGFTGAGHMKDSEERKLNLDEQVKKCDGFIFDKMNDIKDKILLIKKKKENTSFGITI